MNYKILNINRIREIIIEELTLNTRFKNNWKAFTGKQNFKIKYNFDKINNKEKSMEKKSKRAAGAGFLVYKNTKNGIKFLGLIMTKEKRKNNNAIFDIPKGGMDDSETYVECAIRECIEETGITVNRSQIILPGIEIDNIKIFPVESYEKPIIEPNPHSGIVEHEGFEWVSRDVLIDNCIPWLIPYISECMTQIFTDNKGKN
tara:strand:+ start:5487 stop:6092 length:606 start_codon:yes stop_codon:yes gene_type:complete